jgi:hypothetical protein
VYNPGRDVAADVRVRLAHLFAITPTDRSTWLLGDLRPGEEREISVEMTAIAPLDSGSLHITIASANGGSRVLRNHLRINGPLEQMPVHPGVLDR